MVLWLRHLPTGSPRHLRCVLRRCGAKARLAFCSLVELWEGQCEPTSDALSRHLECGRNSANDALRLLEQLGYVKRWRRSAGRDRLINFAVVTDEPFAWETDAALAAKINAFEDEALDEYRARHELTPGDRWTPAPPPPELSTPAMTPETTSHDDTFSQVDSSPLPSGTRTRETPNKNSSLGRTPPNPSRWGRGIHRRRHTTHLAKIVANAPELEPHLPDAIALLHGLGFTPSDRVQHARVVATALHRGQSKASLISYFTERIGSARSRMAVLLWRMRRLGEAIGTTADG